MVSGDRRWFVAHLHARRRRCPDEASKVLQRAHHMLGILPGASTLDRLDEPHEAPRGRLETMAVRDEGAVAVRLKPEVPVSMISDAEVKASIRFKAHHFRLRDVPNQAQDPLSGLEARADALPLV